jgi:hypothetical protein
LDKENKITTKNRKSTNIFIPKKTTHLLSFFSSSYFPFGTYKQRLNRNTAKGVNTKWQSKTMPL